MSETKWLTLEETANKIGLHPRTLRNRISRGDSCPPFAYISRHVKLFEDSDVDDWIRSQKVYSPKT